MFDSDDKKKNVSLEISSKQFFMTSPGSLLGIEGFEQINTSFFATLQIITSYCITDLKTLHLPSHFHDISYHILSS